MNRNVRRIVLLIITLFIGLVPAMGQAQNRGSTDVNPNSVSDQLLTYANVHTPTLVEAYTDFRELENQLEFKDLADYDGSTGMSLTELEVVMEELGIEPQYVEYTDRETLVYYTYESDEIIEELGVPRNTDLCFMFDDDQLISMVITSQAYYLEPEKIYSGADISNWLSNEATVSDIDFIDGTILAYSRLLNNGTAYHAVNVMSTETGSEQMMDNMIFENDVLINSSYYTDDDIPQSLVDSNMFDLIYTVAGDYLDARNETGN